VREKGGQDEPVAIPECLARNLKCLEIGTIRFVRCVQYKHRILLWNVIQVDNLWKSVEISKFGGRLEKLYRQNCSPFPTDPLIVGFQSAAELFSLCVWAHSKWPKNRSWHGKTVSILSYWMGLGIWSPEDAEETRCPQLSTQHWNSGLHLRIRPRWGFFFFVIGRLTKRSGAKDWWKSYFRPVSGDRASQKKAERRYHLNIPIADFLPSSWLRLNFSCFHRRKQ
jgi:hypothetical protein